MTTDSQAERPNLAGLHIRSMDFASLDMRILKAYVRLSSMFQRRDTCALELEAANYFKLDMNQVHQLSKSSTKLKSEVEATADGKHKQGIIYNSTGHLKTKSTFSTNFTHSKQYLAQEEKSKDENVKKKEVVKSKKSNVESEKMNYNKSHYLPPTTKTKGTNDFILESPSGFFGSSSASTNSLPSISSSPSISPSLVCPHLSLDDILSFKNDTNSPHTIGLCAKCRMDPPPNMHSPLSPAFKPTSSKVPKSNFSTSNEEALEEKSHAQSREDHLNKCQFGKKSQSDLSSRKTFKSMSYSHDESLDYFLKPNELRQLQMSPTLRHSVEFIRNNTTEAGRIVRIFKNGTPFERPLRICIMRGEFATLDHLLDYINSRQLIPCGARYLFHLDGQLVYSENELKHGSAYIVSGTRNFDFRASKVLKEQLKEQAIKSVRPQPPQISNSFLDKRKTIESNQAKNGNDLNTPSDKLTDMTSEFVTIKKHHGASLSSKHSVSLSGFRNTNGRKGFNRSPAKKNLSAAEEKLSDTVNKDKKSSIKVDSQETLMTKSSEQLDDQFNVNEEKSAKLARAKSELSALPVKRKKNVTFIDTGRGSSPAITIKVDEQQKKDIHEYSLRSQKKGEKLKDARKVDPKVLKDELSTNEIGIQVSDSLDGYLIDLPIAIPSSSEDTNKSKQSFLKKGQGSQAVRKSSISSKKLDYQRKPTKSNQPIKAKAQIVSIREKQLSQNELNKFKDLDHGDHHNEAHHEEELNNELKNKENSTSKEEEIEMDTLLSDFKPKCTGEEEKLEEYSEVMIPVDQLDQSSNCWQYPNGSVESATPTERPVSQSDANENVHARVITPTPSMSTANESGSFALSYEVPASSNQLDGEQNNRKKWIPVMGALRGGLDPPSRNFKLVWVNGFCINDQQQDNTDYVSFLEPNQQLVGGMSAQFKPSERFQNWFFHSKKHNELVYPAGSLVVLWCRWNFEQRYYSQHTSSICALTLASLDLDLAASAQIANQVENINTCIHLWSLSSLETLSIIEDDHFRGSRIFSLRVKNSVTEGCELSVCARDGKRILLHIFLLNLNDKINEEVNQTELVTTKTITSKSFSKPVYSLQANKLLRTHQIPLHILRISNVREYSASGSKEILNDLILSFGRQHLIVWLLDRKKRQLVRLQPSGQNPEFSELIARANCIERISSEKLLIGDSTGKLNLIIIECIESSIDEKKSPKRKKALPPQYNLKVIPLTKLKSSSGRDEIIAITCLTRISDGLFVGADSECVLHFWQMETSNSSDKENINETNLRCLELNSVRLPRDFGFITTIVLSKYSRKEPMVEFYAASTSNSILFGSAQLPRQIVDQSKDTINNSSSISVIFEGHETSTVNLVADIQNSVKETRSNSKNSSKLSGSPVSSQSDYFTCSLDCRICKWKGKELIWKSILPSACASLAVHPTGFVLAVGSADGTVYILDKISGILISYFPLTPVCINCLAYSKDGSLLAAGCANGSIFILPVYERGLKYKKVSIFQSPHPVVSLQFSLDNKYILTSVTHASYQELILWDLPNFRYMRENVKLAVDKIEWFDSICSGSEDVRAIWENSNLKQITTKVKPLRTNRLNTNNSITNQNTVINLSCHRFVQSKLDSDDSSKTFCENLTIASDIQGYLRLFRYPCYDIQQGFYEIRVSSSPVNCCRFLSSRERMDNEIMFVSTSIDGYIFLWTLI